MKKWKHQIKVGTELFDVVEHTDKECNEPRTDGYHLAPFSHGFVCLYQNGIYKMFCGVANAKDRIVKEGGK